MAYKRPNILPWLTAIACAITLVGVSLFVITGDNRKRVEESEAKVAPHGSFDPWQAREVSEGVHDDGKGNVYIIPADVEYTKEIESLLSRKVAWQKLFPGKRIIAATCATLVGGGNTSYHGLIIFYEEK